MLGAVCTHEFGVIPQLFPQKAAGINPGAQGGAASSLEQGKVAQPQEFPGFLSLHWNLRIQAGSAVPGASSTSGQDALGSDGVGSSMLSQIPRETQQFLENQRGSEREDTAGRKQI